MRNNALKALIALSKYEGEYAEFHDRLRAYGIKWTSNDAFTCFSKIFNNNHDSLGEGYKEFSSLLKPNEQLWLKYLALSGLRRNESIMSFNKIVQLSKSGNLSTYVNELGILEHFRDKIFLRGTKNAFITIIPSSLLNDIKNSDCLNWNSLRKRMDRKHQKYRFKELRSFYSSFMVKNGLIFKVRVLDGNNKLETSLSYLSSTS
jgi:hypothetical protein